MTVRKSAKARTLGFARRNAGKVIAVATVGAMLLGASAAHAQASDQITTTISSVSTYETAAVAVGVAVLLFVIGRKVVRKLI
jgi:hypothetical protein